MRSWKVFPTNGAVDRIPNRRRFKPVFFRVGSRLKNFSLDPALKIHGCSNGGLKCSFGRIFTPARFLRKAGLMALPSFCGRFCLKCSFGCFLEDFQLFVRSYLQLCRVVWFSKFLIELKHQNSSLYVYPRIFNSFLQI